MRKYETKLFVYMPHAQRDWPEDAPEELAVTVTYTYTPASRGTRDDPPHGAEVEVLDARDSTGTEVSDDLYRYIQDNDLFQEEMIEHARD